MKNLHTDALAVMTGVALAQENPQAFDKLIDERRIQTQQRTVARNKYLKSMVGSDKSAISEHNKQIEAKRLEKLKRKNMNNLEQAKIKSTPSSRWFAEGEVDPHEFDYTGSVNEQRARLAMGKLTDDELSK